MGYISPQACPQEAQLPPQEGWRPERFDLIMEEITSTTIRIRMMLTIIVPIIKLLLMSPRICFGACFIDADPEFVSGPT